MKTRAAKKGRGGHNKREGVPRYPSGDVNRDALRRQEEATSIVKAARMRVHGVPANDAASKEAGSVFGRLYLQGELGERTKESGPAEQAYMAGMEFAKRRTAMLAAIQSPRPTRSGSDIGYVHERIESRPEDDDVGPRLAEDDQAYAERCDAARRRYAEIRRVCLEADPFGLMAMETIISEDRMSDRLIGPLRVTCNAIARMMKSERRA